MNCQPGDIAVIKSENQRYNGRYVEVLYAAPPHDFTLPDGHRAIRDYGIDEPSWVVKSIGGPVQAKIYHSDGRESTRMAWYGVAVDKRLRPLRGDPDVVETEEATSV